MVLILFAKSQYGLFDQLVPVAGHTTAAGALVAPHMAIRHIRRTPPKRTLQSHAAEVAPDLFAHAVKTADAAPAKAAETTDLFANAPKTNTSPAPVKSPDTPPTGIFSHAAPSGYPDGKWHAVDTAGHAIKRAGSGHGDMAPRFSDAAAATEFGEKRSDKPAPAGESPPAKAPEHPDIQSDIPADRIVGKINYSAGFDPDTVPDFGVVAGTSKEERRRLNAAGAALMAMSDLSSGHLTDQDRDTLRQYSGNGGCGDSLNEFYTDPKVAAAMWSVLRDLGVREGEVLEPSCATGVFMDTAPSDIRVQGVELDGTSARIATLLHPQHGVVNASLEDFATTDDRRFDAVIGNAPFGLRGKLIRKDKPHLKTAEAYFLDTGLDKLRPGGIMAMIVPTGVMDSKRDRKVRQRLLCKAEFLGALRMPNTAFEHAHTGVTTDVVFFRKRDDDVAGALSVLELAQLQALGVWDEDYVSGAWFDDRGAGHVLGQMEAGWRAKAGMGNDITVNGSMEGVPEAIAGFSPDAVKGEPITVERILAEAPDEAQRERIRGAAITRPYAQSKRGDIKMIDGVQYVLEGEPLRWHRVDEFMGGPAVAEGVALAAEIERALNDDGHAAATGLGDRVKAYVETHGVPSRNADLMLAASRDKSLYRLIGAVRPDGSLSDLASGRTRAAEVVGSFDSAAATLALEMGWFHPSHVAGRWTGGTEDTALDHLYASPEYALSPDDGQWTSQDQYLSGDLWPKLDAARAALGRADLKPEDRAKLEKQVDWLEATIDPRSLEDVEVMINSAFLPLEVVADFFNSRREASIPYGPKDDLEISFGDGIYTIRNAGWSEQLLEKYLNRTGVQKDKDMPTINQWNMDFKTWLCGSEHRDRIEDLYNRSFRGFRPREYSNAPFEVPGLNTDGLKDYQWGGVRWALEAGKGLIAADVGLGKTARALILARMLKATGRAKRPLIIVPKSVLANWAAEAEKWFPGSSVLTIGETYSTDKKGNLKARQDTAAERNRKLHDLTQNDYDFILVSQPAWNDIDLDPETKRAYAEDDFWVQRGEALGSAGDKRINAIRTAHEQSMATRDFQKRTDVIHFNDLGIDALIGDEMHAFKNLYAAKNRFGNQPKFLGGQGLSNRALDMNFKARWIRDQNDGLNVFGLTATPTKNSPLEIYSMLSHIAPEAFEKIGIRNSEEFLDRFCEFREENILTTSGDIDRAMVTVGFKNLDELRGIMRRYIDRKTAEDVGLVLPARDDRQHLVEMSAQQKEVYEHLREQAELSKDKDGPHIFSVMDQMAKAALDLELYDPVAYAGAVSPKYATAAAQIVSGAADGGQVVFCDSLLAHEKIAQALVASGIPRDQIGVINAQVAASSAARQNIADAFNAGRLKVVIGNTATMGEGINLQKGTTDIHHLDLPWEPASMQQRNGRGLRQGNLKESVRIHTYLAKGSFDGYRHQSMRAKKDWQDLLWNGGDRVENLAREGAMSRDDLMIMLSADPDAARESLTKNREEAQRRYDAQQTEAAAETFGRYRKMKASLEALEDTASEAAQRLKVRIDKLRLSLKDNPHFQAKDALDGEGSVLLQPTSGQAFRLGTAVAYAGERFVVSGLQDEANGEFVSLRRYGSTQAGSCKVELAKLGEAVPFDYDAEAEAVEIGRGFADGSKTVSNYDDIRALPASVLAANWDAIQKTAKDGLAAYKFSAGYGDIGFLRKDGTPVATASYSARSMVDHHDLMMPTAEHKALAIQAYITDEKAKKTVREYRPHGHNRAAYGGGDHRDVDRWPGEHGHNSPSNRWGSIGSSLFGYGFRDEADEAFKREVGA